jgi:hypothetical protein
MQRVAATPPESVSELCLIRLGLVVRQLSAWPFLIRTGRAITRSVTEATRDRAGLLHSERYLVGWGHFGVLQYWESYEALEAWSHRAPHSEWWRLANERMRTRGDLGIYHETYLVPRSQVESIYLNCPPLGLGSFGILTEPVGGMTTARDRLGRRGKMS